MKNMTKHRVDSLKCIKKVIVSGNNTLIWTDPWIDNKALVDVLGCDRYLISDHKHVPVSTVIQDEKWNASSISKTKDIAQTIQQVQIGSNGESGYWEWGGQNSFSFPNTWQVIWQIHEQYDCCSIIWNNINSKNMSCCAYRVTIGRVNTTDKLRQWGVNCSEECVLCNEQPETIHHIFFNCLYSRYLWTLMKLKLGMDTSNKSLNLDDEVRLLKTKFQEEDQIKQLAA